MFICEVCKQEFESKWTEEEARAELRQNFGSSIPVEECAQVCDSCYQEIMQWMIKGRRTRTCN